jgi:hypothetical protein
MNSHAFLLAIIRCLRLSRYIFRADTVIQIAGFEVDVAKFNLCKLGFRLGCSELKLTVAGGRSSLPQQPAACHNDCFCHPNFPHVNNAE